MEKSEKNDCIFLQSFNNEKIFPKVEKVVDKTFCNFKNPDLQMIACTRITNVESMMKYIVKIIVGKNTCNFNYNEWNLKCFYDNYQLLHNEYYCTSILRSYVKDCEHIFKIQKFSECVVPIHFDRKIAQLIEIFKNTLTTVNAKNWYEFMQKHHDILHVICNQRDKILKYSNNFSYNEFLDLFANSWHFDQHKFHIDSTNTSMQTKENCYSNSNIDLFAFVSGGILPYCLNITDDSDDIDIYLSILPQAFEKDSKNISFDEIMIDLDNYFNINVNEVNLWTSNKNADDSSASSDYYQQFSSNEILRDKSEPFFQLKNVLFMNETIKFVRDLKICANGHLPNILLYKSMGVNGLIHMASCIINFDLPICKFAYNLKEDPRMNIHEVLKLNFHRDTFFNFDATRDKTLSEWYNKCINRKNSIETNESFLLRRLNREKKYTNRLIDKSQSVHACDTMTLAHLA